MDSKVNLLIEKMLKIAILKAINLNIFLHNNVTMKNAYQLSINLCIFKNNKYCN